MTEAKVGISMSVIFNSVFVAVALWVGTSVQSMKVDVAVLKNSVESILSRDLVTRQEIGTIIDAKIRLRELEHGETK